MDARSIAATALHGGKITAATDINYEPVHHEYHFDKGVYDRRLYNGFGKPAPDTELILGPNITDWPKMEPLAENLLVELAAVLRDDVTTTDELIPSGETSSFRSNPLGLAEFTLSRRDPEYVGRTKVVDRIEKARVGEGCEAELALAQELKDVFDKIRAIAGSEDVKVQETEIGSMVYAVKPGDGSAREQAASCQRVLGGAANLAAEYATKRYRSNVVNWGMLPFIAEDVKDWNLQPGDRIYLPGIRAAVDGGAEEVSAVLLQNGTERPVTLKLPGMTREERDIVLAGCLINYYAK